MKKGIFIAGALTLAAAAALTGCGSSGGGSGKSVNISYWNLLTGADGTVMREMVASFNEEYKDKIYVTEQYASEDVYYDNLELNIPIGRGPDVAIMHSYRVQSYANQGLIYPLDELIQSEGIDMTDFPAQIVSSLEFKNATYAVPFDMHPLGIYYNKTLLAQYGCQVPTNRIELIECAKKADNTDGGVTKAPLLLIHCMASLQIPSTSLDRPIPKMASITISYSASGILLKIPAPYPCRISICLRVSSEQRS